MRVTQNTTLIRRRARLGTYASFGGIAVLAGGMIASFSRNPELVWLSFGALIVGFVLAQIGTYNVRRWGRTPRPDQILETAMKGFDDRYFFLAWTLPAPYVLLSPHGVYCFTTRDQAGQVSVHGNTWRTPFSLGRLLMVFAQEGLGNPGEEAQRNAARLSAWLKKELPDLAVTIYPAVVFIAPRVELTVSEPAVPALKAEDLKKWLRGPGKGDTLKTADFKALEALFNNAAAQKP